MAKVSVVIPVYNVENYLDDCLESVINQTLSDIEIICINDCSTDCSKNILLDYAKKDDRICLIDNDTNRGLSYTRNRGIEVAQGDYIYFLDSDDMIKNQALENLYKLAEDKCLDVICFEADLLFENIDLQTRFRNYRNRRDGRYTEIYTGQDIFCHFTDNSDWVSSIPRYFYRRQILNDYNLRFYEGIFHEDELFTFLLLMKVNRVICIEEAYFIRRFRDNSIMTTDVSIRHLEGLWVCYCEILHLWLNTHFQDKLNECIEMHLFRLYQAIINRFKTTPLSASSIANDIFKDNIRYKHLFNTMFYNEIKKSKYCSGLDDKVIDELRQFNKLILYGAGSVAREVLDILDQNRIGIYGVAVTDKSNNPEFLMGHRVYAIEDMSSIQKEAAVIIAVTSRYKNEMTDRLKELGFNFIFHV